LTGPTITHAVRLQIVAGMVVTLMLSGCSSDGSAGCSDLTPDEVSVLVGPNGANWKGEGELTVTAAQRSSVAAPNDFFTGVVYVQGDSTGSTGDVYVFATAADDLTAPGAGLMGATPFTRDSWVWGDVAQRGAPLEDAARDAVADAPQCLP
jgi:hypothetical protein